MSFFVNTMVCGFSLYQILAFFLIYSCLGWCLEVIYAAVSTGQLVNRGFLNGPVCPIYGFGMILPSVLELVGGWALYKLYHTRWWDYSDFPFNIGGYICLEFSLLWGVGPVVVMKAVHPVIAGFVAMVPQMVGFVLMCILYACYAADVVVTAFAASDLARELDALEKVADSMHAVSDAMTELLGTTAMDVDQKMPLPPCAPRPTRPWRLPASPPRRPGSMPLRPPLPSSWPPRAPQSARQSCSVWNSWPKNCRPAARRCAPAPGAPSTLARAVCSALTPSCATAKSTALWTSCGSA